MFLGHLSKTLEKRESLAVKGTSLLSFNSTYSFLLVDFLDLVLHHLTRNERNLRAQKVYHAKLNELRNLVNGHGSNGCHLSKVWTLGKKSSLFSSMLQQIMILISRCFDVLSEEIGEFLTRQCNVRTASLPVSQTYAHAVEYDAPKLNYKSDLDSKLMTAYWCRVKRLRLKRFPGKNLTS